MLASDGGAGGLLPSDGGRSGGGFLPSDGGRGGGGGFLASDGGGGGGFLASDGGGGGGFLAAAQAGGTVDGGYTTTSVVKREGNAICMAIAALCCGIPLLCMVITANELDLVISEATANLVLGAVKVRDCLPESYDNNKLIYASCEVDAPDIAGQLPGVIRPFYPVFKGADMSWDMEIYQYDETKHEDCHKNNDGSKTCHTTYSYSAGWENKPIDSNRFHSYSYSNNNTDFPENLHGDGSIQAPDHSVILHSHALPTFIAQPTPSEAYALPTFIAQQLPSHSLQPQSDPAQGSMSRGQPWNFSGNLDASALHSDGSGYVSTARGSPRIGDIRIQVSGRMSDTASVAARQQRFQGPGPNSPGFTLDNYPPQKFDMWGRKTYPLARLTAGLDKRSEFIQKWHAQNQAFAWILRIVTLILFVCACNMILEPLSVASDLLRMLNYVTCCLGSVLDNAAQGIIKMLSCGLGCGCAKNCGICLCAVG
jgi:hypothetical protein